MIAVNLELKLVSSEKYLIRSIGAVLVENWNNVNFFSAQNENTDEKQLITEFVKWVNTLAQRNDVEDITLLGYNCYTINILKDKVKNHKIKWPFGFGTITFDSMIYLYLDAKGMFIPQRNKMFLRFPLEYFLKNYLGILIEPYPSESLNLAKGMAIAYSHLQRQLLPRR